jgi:hypothetical protein
LQEGDQKESISKPMPEFFNDPLPSLEDQQDHPKSNTGNGDQQRPTGLVIVCAVQVDEYLNDQT